MQDENSVDHMSCNYQKTWRVSLEMQAVTMLIYDFRIDWLSLFYLTYLYLGMIYSGMYKSFLLAAEFTIISNVFVPWVSCSLPGKTYGKVCKWHIYVNVTLCFWKWTMLVAVSFYGVPQFILIYFKMIFRIMLWCSMLWL